MKRNSIKLGLSMVLVLVALTLNVRGQDNGKTAAAPKPAPKLVVDAATYDFGQVKEGEEVSHTFIVKNEGKAELVITNVSPACGCTASNFSKSVAPNSEGLITLSVKTAGMSGQNERYADIISNDTQNAFYKLWLKVDVVKAETKEAAKMADKTVLDFTLKNIDGKETALSAYKGKVLMLVNVASKCGYTPQYEGLQALYAKYKDQGLVVLGIPANNFGAQEPGTNEEIKQFCTLKYNVSFPMFAKISVKGDDIHPLYKFLTDKTTDPQFGGDIKWNFNKFLVARDGKLIARFESGDKPEGEKVTQAVEQALKN